MTNTGNKIHSIFPFSVCSVFFLFTFFLHSCQPDEPDRSQIKKLPADTSAIKNSRPLDTLLTFHQKYPSEVNFFDIPLIRMRLEELLGERYSFFYNEVCTVESQIIVSNHVLIAEGCLHHFCVTTNYCIVADVMNDVLYVGIRENNVVELYSESGAAHLEMEKWATR